MISKRKIRIITLIFILGGILMIYLYTNKYGTHNFNFQEFREFLYTFDTHDCKITVLHERSRSEYEINDVELKNELLDFIIKADEKTLGPSHYYEMRIDLKIYIDKNNYREFSIEKDHDSKRVRIFSSKPIGYHGIIMDEKGLFNRIWEILVERDPIY